jgi:hypothetical protein
MISQGGTRNYPPHPLTQNIAFAKMTLDGPRGLMLSLQQSCMGQKTKRGKRVGRKSQG